MAKNTRNLLIICIIAVAGAFLMQFLWIRNYYAVNKASFEKEVNLSLEDAVKKEFIVRCDTIERLILKKLLDTNEFFFKSKYAKLNHAYMITIIDKQHLADSSSYHTDSLMKTRLPGDTAYRNKMARYFARSIRVSELESHFIFYHTQKLGNYVEKLTHIYDFDTTRLRPIFKRYLKDRDINTPFVFYLRSKDSIFNKSNFNTPLHNKYQVISKAFITFKQNKEQHYVRAMFVSPFSYIVSKMWLLFAGSLLLITVVAFTLYTLFHSLLTEKKLSGIKNDFISNITHELKTPIAGASAAIEAITNFDVIYDEEKTRRYLGYSKTELQKLSVLVDRVLNISIYEKQLLSIKPEKLNPDDIIPAALLKHKQLGSKNITYTYTNEQANQLVADRMYFEHAINNLTDNAVKYAGDDVEINVTVTARQGFVLIAVKDNGAGIAIKDQQLVFEKFYRVTAGNLHAVKGHGLGLCYVKSIMERHNGWCKLLSEPGSGSTFILGWPI